MNSGATCLFPQVIDELAVEVLVLSRRWLFDVALLDHLDKFEVIREAVAMLPNGIRVKLDCIAQ